MPTDAAKSVAPASPVVVDPPSAGGFGRPDAAAAFAQAQQSAVVAIDRAAAAATAAVRSAADQAALQFTDIQHRVLDRLAEQEKRAAAADAALASRLDTLAELIARAEAIARKPADKNAPSLRDLVERAEAAHGHAQFATRQFEAVCRQAEGLQSELGEAVVGAAEAADALIEERARVARAVEAVQIESKHAECTRTRLAADITAIAGALGEVAARAAGTKAAV